MEELILNPAPSSAPGPAPIKKFVAKPDGRVVPVVEQVNVTGVNRAGGFGRDEVNITDQSQQGTSSMRAVFSASDPHEQRGSHLVIVKKKSQPVVPSAPRNEKGPQARGDSLSSKNDDVATIRNFHSGNGSSPTCAEKEAVSPKSPNHALIRKMKSTVASGEKSKDEADPSLRRSKRTPRSKVRFSVDGDDSDGDESSPQTRGRSTSRRRLSVSDANKVDNSHQNRKRSSSRSTPVTRRMAGSVTALCDLVWAKMNDYPWWPGLVCDDPEFGEFLEKDDHGRIKKVHVQFFGFPRTRAWIANRYKSLVPFAGAEPPKLFKKLVDQNKHELEVAVKEGMEALKVPEDERYLLIAQVGGDGGQSPPGESDEVTVEAEAPVENVVEAVPTNEAYGEWTPGSIPQRKRKSEEERPEARPKKKKIIISSGRDGQIEVSTTRKRKMASPSVQNGAQKRRKVAAVVDQVPGEFRCGSCLTKSGPTPTNWDIMYGARLCPHCFVFLEKQISEWNKSNGKAGKKKVCPKGSDFAALDQRCELKNNGKCDACRLCAVLSAVKSMPFNLFVGLSEQLPNNRIPSSVPAETTAWTSDMRAELALCDEGAFAALPHFTRFLTSVVGGVGDRVVEQPLMTPVPAEIAQGTSLSPRSGIEVAGTPSTSFSSRPNLLGRVLTNQPSSSEVINPAKTTQGTSLSPTSGIEVAGTPSTSFSSRPNLLRSVLTNQSSSSKKRWKFKGKDQPFEYAFSDERLHSFLVKIEPMALRSCLTPILEALNERKKRFKLDVLSGHVICPVCLHLFHVQFRGIQAEFFGGAHMCGTCRSFLESEMMAAIADVKKAEEHSKDSASLTFQRYACIDGTDACKFEDVDGKRCSSCWLFHGINALKSVPHCFEAFRSLLLRLPFTRQPKSLPEGIEWQPCGTGVSVHFAQLIVSKVAPVKNCYICGALCDGENWKIWGGKKVCCPCKEFFDDAEAVAVKNLDVLMKNGSTVFETGMLVQFECLKHISLDPSVDPCDVRSPPNLRCKACWLRRGLENAIWMSFKLYRALCTCLSSTHFPRKQSSKRFGLVYKGTRPKHHFSLTLQDCKPDREGKEMFGPGVMEAKPQVASKLASRVTRRPFVRTLLHRSPLDKVVITKLDKCEVCRKPAKHLTVAEKQLNCRFCTGCASSFEALGSDSGPFPCVNPESADPCPVTSGGFERCSGCWLKKTLECSRDVEVGLFLRLASQLPSSRLPTNLDVANFNVDRFISECLVVARDSRDIGRLQLLKELIDTCGGSSKETTPTRNKPQVASGRMTPSFGTKLKKKALSVLSKQSAVRQSVLEPNLEQGLDNETHVLKIRQSHEGDDDDCFEIPNPNPDIEELKSTLSQSRKVGTLSMLRKINRGVPPTPIATVSGIGPAMLASVSRSGLSNGKHRPPVVAIPLSLVQRAQQGGPNSPGTAVPVSQSNCRLMTTAQLNPRQLQVLADQMAARRLAPRPTPGTPPVAPTTGQSSAQPVMSNLMGSVVSYAMKTQDGQQVNVLCPVQNISSQQAKAIARQTEQLLRQDKQMASNGPQRQQPSQPGSVQHESAIARRIVLTDPSRPTRGPPALLPLDSAPGPSGFKRIRIGPLQGQTRKSDVGSEGRGRSSGVQATQLYYVSDLSKIDWQDHDGQRAQELLQEPYQCEEEEEIAAAFDAVINYDFLGEC